MIAVVVTFQIKPGQMTAFLPLMQDNACTSQLVEAECHQFDICRAGDEVLLYEIYENRAAFDLHLDSAHFKAFDAAVAEMIASKDVRLFEDVTQ